MKWTAMVLAVLAVAVCGCANQRVGVAPYQGRAALVWVADVGPAPAGGDAVGQMPAKPGFWANHWGKVSTGAGVVVAVAGYLTDWYGLAKDDKSKGDIAPAPTFPASSAATGGRTAGDFAFWWNRVHGDMDVTVTGEPGGGGGTAAFGDYSFVGNQVDGDLTVTVGEPPEERLDNPPKPMAPAYGDGKGDEHFDDAEPRK